MAQRLGEPEKLERAESRDLGLRVFMGKRQAIVSSTDFKPDALDELVERAVAMAKVAPEDPHCGIAAADQIIARAPTLDICDPNEPTAEQLVEMARAAGVASIGVAWGYHDTAELKAAGALVILDQLNELPSVLERRREKS